ncbi:MAG TPA: hypothetical protein VGD77_16655 [Gemmatimonadaceae bacterium]|jgi:hypothetical protein
MHQDISVSRAHPAWRIALVAAGATAALMLGACADATGTGGANARTSVSFQAARTTAGSMGSANLSAAVIPVTQGGHTLDITSAEVVVSRVTLKPAGDSAFSEGDSDNESDSDRKDAATVRMGATTIALPLDSGVITPFTSQVPQGTYNRLRLDADYLRVKGTYDAQPFDVTLPVNLHLQLRIAPPLVVGSATDSANVTVNVNVPQWFVRDGTVLDPRRLQDDRSLLNSVRNAIRASFHAYKDRDHDGREHDDDDSDRRR